MRCARCGHANADHALGHCVNRRAYFDPAKGAVVTDVCTCKAFEKAQTPAQAEKAAELAPDPPAPKAEVNKEPEPEPKPATLRK